MAAAAAALRGASAASPSSYRYDLGPGDDIVAPVANLRRRVETELKDGCRVTVALIISRPAGRPDFSPDAASQVTVGAPAEPAAPAAAAAAPAPVAPAAAAVP